MLHTSTYKIESKSPKAKDSIPDINGNKATSYGLIAAEKAGLELTWVLILFSIYRHSHELSKHKSLGVKTVQCEDEIAGCASAVGAAAGDLCCYYYLDWVYESEAMNLTQLNFVV